MPFKHLNTPHAFVYIRRCVQHMRLFLGYDLSFPRAVMDPAVSSLFRFEIEIEPIFGTLALYDVKEKKKVGISVALFLLLIVLRVSSESPSRYLLDSFTN